MRIGKAMDYNYRICQNPRMRRPGAEIEAVYESARQLYENLLEQGVAREHARMVLPVSQFTTFFWTRQRFEPNDFPQPSKFWPRAI